MADETPMTKYLVERRIDAWTITEDGQGALPEGSLVFVACGEFEAHGARVALRKWAEAQGAKFEDGHYRAIPVSNITEDDLEGETKTTTTIRSKRA